MKDRRPRFEPIAQEICAAKSWGAPAFVGTGAFKEVYKTADGAGKPLAIKVFDPDKCDLARAEREIHSMLRCDTRLIGKLIGWGSYRKGDHSYLHVFEEYFDGGALQEKLEGGQCLPAVRVLSYGKYLMTAVSHLRTLSLVHRDIKPDNIMFRADEDIPVVVDFGLVRDLNSESLTMSYFAQGPCTPYFASPEQLNNEKHLIDWRSDQFSVGVVLSLCIFGLHPYSDEGDGMRNVVSKVAGRKGCSRYFMGKAEEVGFGIISKMTSSWPIDRFSSPEAVLEALANIKVG